MTCANLIGSLCDYYYNNYFHNYKVIISGLLFQYMKRISSGTCHAHIVKYVTVNSLLISHKDW